MRILSRLLHFRRRYRGAMAGELFLRIRLRFWDFALVRTVFHYFRRAPIVRPGKIVFLVGCYNSGTTITREILGAHPELRLLPREGARLASDLPRPEDLGWTRMWVGCKDHMKMPSGEGDGAVERILRDWAPWWIGSGTVYLEKSITNVTRMEWLDQHFGNAYFIGIVRNGYCAIEGISRRAKPCGRAEKAVGGSYPMEMIAEQWVDANQQMIEGAKRVTRYMQITYENLVNNPKETLDEIWGFLDVEGPKCSYNNHILHLHDKSFRLTYMNDASLANLSRQSIETINPVISGMQEHFGYEVL